MSSVNGIPSDGEWFLAEGTFSMIRARQNLLPLALESGLTERVVVTWHCRSPVDGLPSETDYVEIAQFEELLVRFLEHGAILAFVITRDGCANLNFYTSSTEWFVERLNEALCDKSAMPIELSGEEDPEWSEYKAVLEATGMGGSAD
jgi:hypothetical protein